MVIQYHEFVAELSRRSIKNYDYVKNKAEDDKLYEVTQLINSMYCMIVVPEEIFGINHRGEEKTDFGTREEALKKYHNEYRAVNDIIEKLKRNKRVWDKSINEYVQNSPVCAFINNIRNSLCHDGIGFLPVQTEVNFKLKNSITDVIFESKTMSGKVSFISIIDIDTLEELLRAISALYCRVEEEKHDSNFFEYFHFYSEIESHVKKYLRGYK